MVDDSNEPPHQEGIGDREKSTLMKEVEEANRERVGISEYGLRKMESQRVEVWRGGVVKAARRTGRGCGGKPPVFCLVFTGTSIQRVNFSV